MARVAILGWGSLLWDKRSLRIPGQWHSDGPFLPIEFARTSGVNDKEGKPPYLSLVLHRNAGLIRTYWDVSLLTEHTDDVICDLRKRERCSLSAIACLPRNRPQSIVPGVDGRILEWLDSRRSELDAVIWTNLRPKLDDREAFTVHDSIQWLDGLRARGQHERAEEYIRKAPSQTDTCLRHQVRERFGWTDIATGF